MKNLHQGSTVGAQSKNTTKELTIQRMVSGSPETVFAHWTEEKKLRQWWGPRTGTVDWTTPTVEIEPPKGGGFRTCIRSPEGEEYWARGQFKELEAPTRIVLTHQWEGGSEPQAEEKRLCLDLKQVGAKTRICLRIEGYRSEESRDQEIEGWYQCIDRLAELLRGSTDEASLREIVAKWSKCVETKNAEELVKHYAEEVVLYDAIPPYKIVGKRAVKEAWESCFPWLPEKCGSEHRDLRFHLSGDLAMVHGLHRFRPEPENHPCGSGYMRLTLVFRKTQSGWMVIHEHISNPFNPMDEKVWSIKDPEVLDRPDYQSCPATMEVKS